MEPLDNSGAPQPGPPPLSGLPMPCGHVSAPVPVMPPGHDPPSDRAPDERHGSIPGQPAHSWHRETDMRFRRQMINHILRLLKKDVETYAVQLRMVKHFEHWLYRNARSLEAYMDFSTLKNRVQQWAMEVSSTNPADGERKESALAPSRQHNPPPEEQNGRQHGWVIKGSGSLPFPADSQQAAQLQPSQPNQKDSIVIRHKQQRLLLLYHSGKCRHEAGPCPVTPHCADMKGLWEHMEQCKDNECGTAHCLSSRRILSHYRMCKNAHCQPCGPVRDVVRKSKTPLSPPTDDFTSRGQASQLEDPHDAVTLPVKNPGGK